MEYDGSWRENAYLAGNTLHVYYISLPGPNRNPTSAGTKASAKGNLRCNKSDLSLNIKGLKWDLIDQEAQVGPILKWKQGYR